MAGVHFKVTGDANGYMMAVRQAEAATGELTRRVENEGDAIDKVFKKLATGAMTLGAGLSATKLINDIFFTASAVTVGVVFSPLVHYLCRQSFTFTLIPFRASAFGGLIFFATFAEPGKSRQS